MTAVTSPPAASKTDERDFLRDWMTSRRQLVEAALRRSVSPSPGDPVPSALDEAMAYSLLAGGKRLRPLLVLAGAEAVGAEPSSALPAAMAVECVHTYSLVHDDLPSMDDDDLRRGKPTSHIVHGEAMAILSGDGLLTRAFELLSKRGFADTVGADTAIQLVAELSTASGAAGMVGGQVVDIEEVADGRTLDGLKRLHRLKTGALIRASVVCGGLAGGAGPAQLAALRTYGEALGLGFQIVDDVLDVTASTEALGKPSGSDARNGKSTYVDLLGLEGARAHAAEVLGRAREVVAPFGDAARPLAALADYVQNRGH